MRVFTGYLVAAMLGMALAPLIFEWLWVSGLLTMGVAIVLSLGVLLSLGSLGRLFR